MAKNESNKDDQETLEEEAAESPEMQQQEEASGSEQSDDGEGENESDSGHPDIKISEQFQKEVTPYIQEATRPELEFMRSLIMEREAELRKAETKSEKASDFTTEGMPSD